MATKRKAPPKAPKAAKAKAGKAPVDGNGDGEGGPDPAQLKKIFEDAGMGVQTGAGLKYADVECPYCGEEFEVRVDTGIESFEMVEECRGCSKMVSLSVTVEDGEVSIAAYQN